MCIDSLTMTTHTRSPGQTAISVSIPRSLLDDIDRRAEALGLSRSQYLTQLARQDIAAKGSLILQEKPTEYKSSEELSSDRKVELADEALKLLKQDLSKKKSHSKPGASHPA